jgi:hypothetical protein
VGSVERKILVAVHLIFRICVVFVGAIVSGTSEGPDIGGVVEGTVGVVVFGCGCGIVELDQQKNDGKSAYDKWK